MNIRTQSRRKGEDGFALLFVFAMAAAVAIGLYLELPRVVFEQQRVKEDLLVERGEQYKRAIQLYVRKVNKYPQRLEDLEDYNGQRFLRRQYKDPMTGGDWKIIKINQAGVLENSLVQKKTDPLKAKNGDSSGLTSDSSSASSFGLGSSSATGEDTQQQDAPLVSVTDIRGASDRGINPTAALGGAAINPATGQPYLPGEQPIDPTTGQPYPPGTRIDPTTGQPYPPGTQFDPVTGQPIGSDSQTGSNAGLPTQIAGVDPSTGQPITVQVDPVTGQQVAINPATGQPYPAGQGPVVSSTAAPVSAFPGIPRQPISIPGQTGAGLVASAVSSTPGVTGPAPQQAMDMIRNILTRPRAGGLQGIQASSSQSRGLGAGIAGVASTAEVDGIKIYNDQTAYNKWEFIYDYAKDNSRTPSAAKSTQSNTGSGGLTNPGNQSSFGTGLGSPMKSGSSGSTIGSFGGTKR